MHVDEPAIFLCWSFITCESELVINLVANCSLFEAFFLACAIVTTFDCWRGICSSCRVAIVIWLSARSPASTTTATTIRAPATEAASALRAA